MFLPFLTFGNHNILPKEAQDLVSFKGLGKTRMMQNDFLQRIKWQINTRIDLFGNPVVLHLYCHGIRDHISVTHTGVETCLFIYRYVRRLLLVLITISLQNSRRPIPFSQTLDQSIKKSVNLSVDLRPYPSSCQPAPMEM